MDKSVFGRGIQMLNAVLSEDRAISEKSTLDLYYMSLESYENEEYIKGIMNMIKEENLIYAPSIALIIKYIENERKKSSKYKMAKRIFQQIMFDKILYREKKVYLDEIEEIIKELGGWNLLNNEKEESFINLYLNKKAEKMIEKRKGTLLSN